ncbi:MAG: SDR family NAD(P)-dependent oxidoreductase [Ignavibacterium sp.]|jgi:NAD(P)-dependent dehydrogenase (short-subunit alcohol dehydrogenase family)|uniref:SDR family NAD(P)-dependent oxidoreductase n=1 Tax=Ignavibacterium sp. TaxID=2651167 RepID=UPI00329A78BE
MKRRIVIITGANSGIGKAAAIKFASENHTVIMACRDLTRSENAFKQAQKLSANSDVHLMRVDISSFKSIKKFAQEFKSKFNKLDILINNAAFFEHGKRGYQMSEDGIELTFATNTFGPFFMTELLKDFLSKSDDARILNACTENIMHFFDPKRQIEFDNLKANSEAQGNTVFTKCTVIRKWLY